MKSPSLLDKINHITSSHAELLKALTTLLSLHSDACFICGVDDQAKVDAAISAGRRAVENAKI